MPKCIFNKKHTKRLNRCEITGKLMKGDCYFYGYDYGKFPCKHFKMNLIDRFFYWIDKKLS